MGRSFRILAVTGGLLLVGLIALWRLEHGRPRGGLPRLPVLRETRAFAATNQAGLLLSSETLRGKPWAVNLIFTRCPGPCRQLTGVMRKVQEGLGSPGMAGLISLTSDPDHDTPKVLSEYAAKVGADTNRWHFLTGPKADIRRLVTEEFLLVVQDKPEAQRQSEDDLFLHSTLIVIMDGRGRLRTAIEGLEPGAAERVLDALRTLANEG